MPAVGQVSPGHQDTAGDLPQELNENVSLKGPDELGQGCPKRIYPAEFLPRRLVEESLLFVAFDFLPIHPELRGAVEL